MNNFYYREPLATVGLISRNRILIKKDEWVTSDENLRHALRGLPISAYIG